MTLTSLAAVVLLAATAFPHVPPTTDSPAAAGRRYQRRVPPAGQRRGGARRRLAVSPQSQAVFNEVKARLLAVAGRRPRPQADKYVWPPPIELTGSAEFDAYATRFWEGAGGSEIEPTEGGRFKPHIVISQGVMSDLIENNADRLAFVMGHEIAHVMLRHVLPGSLRERAETTGLAVIFTAEQEHDADVLGMQLALGSNYSVKGAREIWTRINSTDFTAKYPGFNYTSFEGVGVDHPAWSDRLGLIDSEKASLWKAMSAFENGVYFLIFQSYANAEESFKRVVDDTGCNQKIGGKPNCKGFPDSYDAWANLGYARLMQYFDKLDDKDVRRYGLGQLVTGSFYKRPASLAPQVRAVDAALWNGAVKALGEALKLNPSATLARANLGVAYLMAPTGRNTAVALRHLEQAVGALQNDDTLTDENRAAVHINTAVVLIAAGDADKAAARLASAEKVMKGGEMDSALKYNRALLLSRSADAAPRKEAAELIVNYLKQEEPTTLWWSYAYDLYSKLTTETGGTLTPAAELQETWRAERRNRPVGSVTLDGGVLITLSDPVETLQAKLGAAKPVPVVAGTNVVRLFYPERGLELLATRRVLAIFLRGAAAPGVKVQRVRPGAPVLNLSIGMTADEVQKLIGEEPSPLELAVPNVTYDFYPGTGVGVRYDGSDRVEEIVIASPVAEA
jgi:tetratricopeptide (TPR) repeat protein